MQNVSQKFDVIIREVLKITRALHQQFLNIIERTIREAKVSDTIFYLFLN
jgi:hypothetical protein